MQQNVQLNDRDIFNNPFDTAEIEELLQGKSASEMFNFKSPSFKKLDIEQDKLYDNELINFMLEEPRFIRRPVVRIGDKVYFGANKAMFESLIS